MIIIAEIAQAHDGSLGIAHSYIDALSQTGVDAVKFQTHIAGAESSMYEPFRTNFSYEDTNRFEYWRRMEFTEAQWLGLKKHCDEVGLEFMSSPFSNEAVDLLERLGIKRYKVGSGEVSNDLLLQKISNTGKPIILSSGMSSFAEIESSVEFLKSKKVDLSILQCTTAYPTNPKQWGLNVISELRNRFNVPVGFSDHSGDIYACLAATAIGAEILEFHVTFDKQMFGPDAKASLTLDQVSKLTEGVNQIRIAKNYLVDKSHCQEYDSLKKIFEKSLSVNRDVSKGETIKFEDLEAKKPKGYGISANKFQNIIGKKYKRALDKWAFLKMEDIED